MTSSTRTWSRPDRGAPRGTPAWWCERVFSSPRQSSSFPWIEPQPLGLQSVAAAAGVGVDVGGARASGVALLRPQQQKGCTTSPPHTCCLQSKGKLCQLMITCLVSKTICLSCYNQSMNEYRVYKCSFFMDRLNLPIDDQGVTQAVNIFLFHATVSMMTLH